LPRVFNWHTIKYSDRAGYSLTGSDGACNRAGPLYSERAAAARSVSTMPPDRLIEVNHLHRSFGPLRAVQDVSFSVARGELVGLLGVNGAGKSTTMDLLCGVLSPDSGEIAICGIDLRRRPRLAKRHLGYLPEQPPLYPELTVSEYLSFCGRLHGLRGARLRAALERTLHDCALHTMPQRLIGALSKGHRQRVGLAQALLHEPDVLVLDEPSAGLDPLQLRDFRTLLAGLAPSRAILLSTHLLPEATAVCSRVLIMREGRLVHQRSLADTAEHTTRLTLHCAALPDLEAVRALPGVREAQPEGERGVTVTVAGATDPAPELARLAVDRGWGLLELTRERSSLERVFVELSCERPVAEP